MNKEKFNLFELDYDSIDFAKNIDLNNTLLPPFIHEYLNELKSNLIENGTNSDRSIFMCEVLIDYSWEYLNTNLWVFVDDIWRWLYGYSILYKILFFYKKNRKNEFDFNEKLIKLCDLGLLMSGPLLEKKFNKIINSLNVYPNTSNKKMKYSNDEPKLLNEPKLNEKFKLSFEDSPTVSNFQLNYFSKKIPTIIDGQMKHWPAIKKWRLSS